MIDIITRSRKGTSQTTNSERYSKHSSKMKEQSLLEIYNKHNLSDEEIIIKFFTHINYLPEKKDYFIRDFEEFYFKIRPKFSSKLIKVLLEVMSI